MEKLIPQAEPPSALTIRTAKTLKLSSHSLVNASGSMTYPPVICYIAILKMTIEIVDFSIKDCDFPVRYVSH